MACNEDIFFYLPRNLPFFWQGTFPLLVPSSFEKCSSPTTPQDTGESYQPWQALGQSERLHATDTVNSWSFFKLGLKEKGQTILLWGQAFQSESEILGNLMEEACRKMLKGVEMKARGKTWKSPTPCFQWPRRPSYALCPSLWPKFVQVPVLSLVWQGS